MNHRVTRANFKNHIKSSVTSLEQRAEDLAIQIKSHLEKSQGADEVLVQALKETFEFIEKNIEEVRELEKQAEILANEAETYKQTADFKTRETKALKERLADLEEESNTPPGSPKIESYQNKIRELRIELKAVNLKLQLKKRELNLAGATSTPQGSPNRPIASPPPPPKISPISKTVGATNFDMAHFSYLSGIPIYTGEDRTYTFSDFLENINSLGKLAGWDEDAKLEVAKMRIAGKAKQIYKTKKPSTFKEFSDLFLNHITNSVPLMHYMLMFVSCAMKPSEVVDDFAHRLERYTNGALPEKNDPLRKGVEPYFQKLQKHIFIAGLKPELKQFVELRDPKTLKEAIDIARDREATITSRPVIPLHPLLDSKLLIDYEEECPGQLLPDPQLIKMEKLVAALQTQTESLQKQVNEGNKKPKQQYRGNNNRGRYENRGQRPNNYYNNKPTKKCFICQRNNHLAKQCFYNERNKPQNYQRSTYSRNFKPNGNNNYRSQPNYQRNYQNKPYYNSQRQGNQDKYYKPKPQRQEPNYRGENKPNRGWEQRINTVRRDSDSVSCTSRGSSSSEKTFKNLN